MVAAYIHTGAKVGVLVEVGAGKESTVATEDFKQVVRSEEHTSELQSPVDLYLLSLHDALPISWSPPISIPARKWASSWKSAPGKRARSPPKTSSRSSDRKSTRLNSSHPSISTFFPYTTLFRSHGRRLYPYRRESGRPRGSRRREREHGRHRRLQAGR